MKITNAFKIGLLGGLGVLDQQRLQAGLDRRGDPVDLRRLTAEEAGDAVAQPADPRLERPHHVTRPDHLVPSGEHLAAEQRAAPERSLDLAERGGVGAVELGPELRSGGELVDRGPFYDRRAGRQARESPS